MSRHADESDDEGPAEPIDCDEEIARDLSGDEDVVAGFLRALISRSDDLAVVRGAAAPAQRAERRTRVVHEDIRGLVRGRLEIEATRSAERLPDRRFGDRAVGLLLAWAAMSPLRPSGCDRARMPARAACRGTGRRGNTRTTLGRDYRHEPVSADTASPRRPRCPDNLKVGSITQGIWSVAEVAASRHDAQLRFTQIRSELPECVLASMRKTFSLETEAS